MNTRAIIFDLDGTLINTVSDLAASMNHGLKSLGHPARTEDECMKMIGNGVKLFAQRALPPDHPEDLEKLLTLMKEHYQAHCCDNSSVYPGIADLIDQLSQKGVKLGVLTNKPDKMATRVVEHYFGKGTFDAIFGVKESRKIKPDPAGVNEMLQRFQAPPEQCLFAGDSDVDIITARGANIPSIAVTWGFRPRQILEKEAPSHIVDTPAEILSLIS